MKKIFIIFSLSLVVYACGNQDAGTTQSGNAPAGNTTGEANSTAPTTTPAAPAASADVTENPDYVAGLELIAKSDCLTCHKVDDKVIGPAYREVANKYPNDEKNINMLVDKVIKGGSGNWGPIAMTPHPNLSREDATKMVKYILLLKK
jgi:cytochrome c